MNTSSPLLTRRALYEEVADALRQRIFTRALKPGEHIDEVALTQEMGISRTPLREALKVLASEGLVTMKVRRGAYVTEADEKDLRDIYQLLALLESDAAARVAANATSQELNTLQLLHDELATMLEQRERFFLLNEQFHQLLVQTAANRWQAQMVADLRKVMKLHRHNSLFKYGRIQESFEEHCAIMDALHARDAERARLAMSAHFANGLQAAI